MTVSVKYSPMMTSGKVMGCELIWSMLAQDYASKQNAIINATGSIAVMRPSPTSNVVVTLKIKPGDYSAKTDTFERFVPVSANFVMGTMTSKEHLLASQPSDTGGLFAVFKAGPMLDPVLEAMEKGSITVAFTRHPGSLDIILPINTRVASTDLKTFVQTTSKQMMVDFIDCAAIVVNGSE